MKGSSYTSSACVLAHPCVDAQHAHVSRLQSTVVWVCVKHLGSRKPKLCFRGFGAGEGGSHTELVMYFLAVKLALIVETYLPAPYRLYQSQYLR